MKIGTTNNGLNVCVSESAMNTHIGVFGLSGSGKSTRINSILSDCLSDGYTVLVFDFDGMNRDKDGVDVNRIDIEKEGMAVPLLDTTGIEHGVESYTTFVGQITDLLARTQNFGVRQLGYLRHAIIYAIEHMDEYDSDLKAIADALMMEDSTIAQGVYNRLWTLLHTDVFRKNGRDIIPGKINVLDMSSMETATQSALVEIILGVLWRNIRLRKSGQNRIAIILDEFQRLYIPKKSVILELLRESRRYGISLILVTQSAKMLSTDVLNAVGQCSTTLYFYPDKKEVSGIAKLIDPVRHEKYTLLLKKLKKGESIVCGKVEIAGTVFEKPFIIQTDPEYIKSQNLITPSILLGVCE